MATTTSKPSRWATIRRWLFLVLPPAALVILIYLIYAGSTYGWPDWTGFGSYTPPQPPIEGYQREKTLWDWLQLLIIPIVLAVGGFFLNRTERINAEKAAERRAETEREIAERRDETERKIGEKRTQDAVLETYLDCMADLLFDQKLLKSQPDGEVRYMARIRTLTALRRLNGEHNQILIQFLRDAGLLVDQSNIDTSIVDMSNADLRGADLEGTKLHGVNLQGADLQEVNLQGADLQEANLRGAVLVRANLRGAFLVETNLQGAVLPEANLQMADLRGANLEGANLRRAVLDKAKLQGAKLKGATMPDGSKHE